MSSSNTVRLLHLADVHLGVKCAFLEHQAKQDERAKDFERAFRRAIELARAPENGINLVIIAGDLFDSHKPDRRLVELVKSEFALIGQAGIRVVLIPGTHDTASYRNSIYKTEKFGDAIVITDNRQSPMRLEVAQQPVSLYSVVRTPDCREVPLDRLSRVSGDGIHIGVLHAAVPDKSSMDFSDTEFTITLPTLARTRLDYVALGHFHNFKQYYPDGVTVVYPGTLEGRSFRETGERYLVTATFAQGKVLVEKTPINARTVRDETIDLARTPCAHRDELLARIEKMAGDNVIMRLAIAGTADFTFDAATIESALADKFFYLKLVDDTRVYDARWAEQYQNERTVRGVFVRRLIDRIEKARTPEEKKVLDMALKFGLLELSGPDAD